MKLSTVITTTRVGWEEMFWQPCVERLCSIIQCKVSYKRGWLWSNCVFRKSSSNMNFYSTTEINKFFGVENTVDEIRDKVIMLQSWQSFYCNSDHKKQIDKKSIVQPVQRCEISSVTKLNNYRVGLLMVGFLKKKQSSTIRHVYNARWCVQFNLYFKWRHKRDWVKYPMNVNKA